PELCPSGGRAILGRMLETPITAPGAWRRRDVRPEDYRVTLSPACRDELLRAADTLAANPLPTILLDPAEFDLPHCRAAMATANTGSKPDSARPSTHPRAGCAALPCVTAATRGGHSRVMGCLSGHTLVVGRDRALRPRLFRGLWVVGAGEFADGEAAVFSAGV